MLWLHFSMDGTPLIWPIHPHGQQLKLHQWMWYTDICLLLLLGKVSAPLSHLRHNSLWSSDISDFIIKKSSYIYTVYIYIWNYNIIYIYTYITIAGREWRERMCVYAYVGVYRCACRLEWFSRDWGCNSDRCLSFWGIVDTRVRGKKEGRDPAIEGTMGQFMPPQ